MGSIFAQDGVRVCVGHIDACFRVLDCGFVYLNHHFVLKLSFILCFCKYRLQSIRKLEKVMIKIGQVVSMLYDEPRKIAYNYCIPLEKNTLQYYK